MASNKRTRNKDICGDGSSVEPFHAVVVGAGMAGLTCARELLASCPDIHVTILEAADVAGGRVRKIASTSDGKAFLDAGAEFIHGRDHILWDTIRDFQRRGLLPTASNQTECEEPFEFDALEPHFILAHADGGPQDDLTPQGKYGMYYIHNELVMYNDPEVQPLVDVIEAIANPTHSVQYTDSTSLLDALSQNDLPPLNTSLMQLFVAGYGNTAGCCDLSQLSMRLLIAFENYWESNEVEGDYRPTFGMYRLVDAMIQDLQEYNVESSKFDLCLNTPVERILPEDSKVISSGMSCRRKIKLQLGGDEIDSDSSSVLADAVVITVPPTRLLQLFDNGHSLPQSKQEALARIGFADRIIKICCKFQTSFWWPHNLQSIIAAGQPIPELWFRELQDNCYVVVGYLVSTAANQLLEQIHEMQARAQLTNIILSREHCAEQIMIQQLSTMLKMPLVFLRKECLQDETILVDWKDDFPFVQGGYMFPKAGMRVGHDLEALAESMMDGRVVFAGEATNTNACCTIQAAMETGVRAAKEISSMLRNKIS